MGLVNFFASTYLTACLFEIVVLALDIPDVTIRDAEYVRGQQKKERHAIFFTHMQRGGGTHMEDKVIIPTYYGLYKTGVAFHCDESYQNFAALDNSQYKKFQDYFYSGEKRFQYRHCPFDFVDTVLNNSEVTDAALLVTHVVHPLRRYVSWFKYCHFPCRNDWFARFRSYERGKDRSDVLLTYTKYYKERIGQDFQYNPQDNYQTRMLCSSKTVNQHTPVTIEDLKCAMKHLYERYHFIGSVLDNTEESMCMMRYLIANDNGASVGGHSKRTSNKNSAPGGKPKLRVPVTKNLYNEDDHVIFEVSVDFLTEVFEFIKFDVILWKFGLMVFAKQLFEQVPQCVGPDTKLTYDTYFEDLKWDDAMDFIYGEGASIRAWIKACSLPHAVPHCVHGK
eukprot:m.110099 g.110099  ORF g.110099 m.110099 type:complete len:393 (+) comp14022_c0_seq2:77-1255(+)